MNYVNSISIYGFMNKNSFIDEDSIGLTFWKKKDKKYICICRDNFNNYDINNFDKISYMYMEKPLNIKGETSMDEITSIIDKTYLENILCRQNHKEIYETYRKYYNKIKVINDIDYIKIRYNDIINMIETWRYADYGGMKYMWQERAGIDKAFITRYLNDIYLQNNCILYLFIYNETNDIIGYSVIPKLYELNDEQLPVYSYMLRKCILKSNNYNLRNITEYIDWYTFNETLKNNNFDKIIINWGCSTGGVKWYKIHKWPLYKLEKKYFLNYKKC